MMDPNEPVELPVAPPAGTLPYGQVVYVDDGSSPGTELKITGGNTLAGIPRSVVSVPDPDDLPNGGPVPGPAAPTVAFTPGVTFSNAHTATLTGTASDPSVAVTGVEVFDNGTDLGAATLNGDGTWTLANAPLTSGVQSLTAIATDAAGNKSQPTPPPFTLETGIKGPYSSDEEDFDSSGNLTSETFTKRNGAIYLHDVVTNKPNGDHVIDYDSGTYFNKQSFFFKEDVFAPDYSQKTETLYNNDGSHTITGFGNGEKLSSLHDDTLTGGGRHETFVFKAHFGQDLITDFRAGGPGHDTLSLSSSEFSSIAQVLNHTHDVNGSAEIKVGPHDTITLQNVTKAELQAHQNDFKFHA